MHLNRLTPAVVGCVTVLGFFTTACATKKNVREAVAPVQQQVNDVQKKTGENTTAIGDLDRNVAKVDEKAMEADRKAAAAAQAADKASQAAGQAQQTANSANDLAQQGITKAGNVDVRVTNLVNGLDNFKLVKTEKVYFPFNRAELTTDEKAKLDEAIQGLQNVKNYVIEIAGYTDKTGSRYYNLELSRRRADAVVRYLTVDHNVQLRKVHDVGAGSEFPDADNATRAARKENRRVDVRIYAFDGESGQGNAANSAASNGSLGAR